jgi:signal transduction histidine kinase
MRSFLHRALRKFDKLTKEQLKPILASASDEVIRFEAALDSIDAGLIICDTRHRLLFMNRCAERFLPISNPGAALPIWQIIEDDDVAAFLQAVLQSGDRAEDREFDVEKNPIERRLSFSILPLVEERHVTGSLILVSDITDRREREAVMRRVQSLASLTTLAAGVAHEIKNPLGSISIHIQLIKKALARGLKLCLEAHRNDPECPDPRLSYDSLEKYLGVVTDEIDRLNRIVVDFLHTVRPMSLEPRLGSINTLLSEMLEFFRFELNEAGITIKTSFSDAVPPIFFDEHAIKQAFLNLLKNAKEAMAETGGTLKVTTAGGGGAVKITVEDSGCGIAKDKLDKIFEPYWTTKPNGSGLGLLMSFKIIREHDGAITVRSREGAGARFIITLPAPKEDPRLIAYRGGPR